MIATFQTTFCKTNLPKDDPNDEIPPPHTHTEEVAYTTFQGNATAEGETTEEENKKA
jgi:hypothetical protein